MAIKEQASRIRPRYRDYVIQGLASPFSFLDIFADIHLADSPEQADARALREDWEIVGECIWDAMEEQPYLIESRNRKKHDQ